MLGPASLNGIIGEAEAFIVKHQLQLGKIHWHTPSGMTYTETTAFVSKRTALASHSKPTSATTASLDLAWRKYKVCFEKWKVTPTQEALISTATALMALLSALKTHFGREDVNAEGWAFGTMEWA